MVRTHVAFVSRLTTPMNLINRKHKTFRQQVLNSNNSHNTNRRLKLTMAAVNDRRVPQSHPLLSAQAENSLRKLLPSARITMKNPCCCPVMKSTSKFLFHSFRYLHISFFTHFNDDVAENEN